jgi:FlaA1/EpsC-like NDP-sugar epimerase
MGAPEHILPIDEPSATSAPRNQSPAGSPTAPPTEDLVQPRARWQRIFGQRLRFSSEFLSVSIAWLDFCLVSIIAAVVFSLYFNILNVSTAEPGRYVPITLFAAMVFVGGFQRMGGCQLNQLLRLNWQLTRILMMWGIALSVLLLTAFFGTVSESYSRGWALAWFAAVPPVLCIARRVLYGAGTRWVESGHLVRNIVIVGAAEEGQRLIAKLQRLRDKSIAIRGVFDDRKSRFRRSALGLNILDTSDDLVRVARRAPVEEAIIALPLGAEERLESLFWKSEGIAASSQSPKPSRFAELRRHCAGAQNHRSSL